MRANPFMAAHGCPVVLSSTVLQRVDHRLLDGSTHIVMAIAQRLARRQRIEIRRSSGALRRYGDSLPIS